MYHNMVTHWTINILIGENWKANMWNKISKAWIIFPFFGLKIHCILGLLEKKTSTPMKKLQSGFSYFLLNYFFKISASVIFYCMLFFISITFISIYRLRFSQKNKHMINILFSLKLTACWACFEHNSFISVRSSA